MVEGNYIIAALDIQIDIFYVNLSFIVLSKMFHRHLPIHYKHSFVFCFFLSFILEEGRRPLSGERSAWVLASVHINNM
jgi:hypothetical protein